VNAVWSDGTTLALIWMFLPFAVVALRDVPPWIAGFSAAVLFLATFIAALAGTGSLASRCSGCGHSRTSEAERASADARLLFPDHRAAFLSIAAPFVCRTKLVAASVYEPPCCIRAAAPAPKAHRTDRAADHERLESRRPATMTPG